MDAVYIRGYTPLTWDDRQGHLVIVEVRCWLQISPKLHLLNRIPQFII